MCSEILEGEMDEVPEPSAALLSLCGAAWLLLHPASVVERA